jgi:hypothetical protein
MSRGPKLLNTQCSLNESAMLVARKVILPTNAPIRALVPQITASTPAPTYGANFVHVAAKQKYAHRRVNHVAMEETQEAPDVVLGMFFINATSPVVLFHAGALQSFISAAYVEKHNLPIALLTCQMIVSAPGGDKPTRQLCPKVNLKIKGVDFVANLIVLESKSIDVILRID